MFSLRAAFNTEHRVTMLLPTAYGIYGVFGRRNAMARRSSEMFEYLRAVMRVRATPRSHTLALIGRTNLGESVLFEHFHNEHLDEFNVYKWDLGVDHLPLAFKFR